VQVVSRCTLYAVDLANLKVILCERSNVECSDDDHIFELIHKHFARAFRDTTVQDCVVFATQELLKLVG
jgi:serine/threonine-protein kinase ATR